MGGPRPLRKKSGGA